MHQKLKGKVAVITGASSGIGRACAFALAEQGVKLVLTARRHERLEEVKQRIESSGSGVIIVPGDAREQDTAINVIKAATDTYNRVDILVNSAGIGLYKKIADTSVLEYDEMMDSNVRSTFLFSRQVIPAMVKQKSGMILIISSTAGLQGFGGEAVYCMTKFAQVGFAQALERELRNDGIKVSTICPGGVKTEFAIGKGRTEEAVRQSNMLDAEDVAAVVLAVCTQSPKSRIVQVQIPSPADNV